MDLKTYLFCLNENIDINEFENLEEEIEDVDEQFVPAQFAKNPHVMKAVQKSDIAGKIRAMIDLRMKRGMDYTRARHATFNEFFPKTPHSMYQ